MFELVFAVVVLLVAPYLVMQLAAALASPSARPSWFSRCWQRLGQAADQVRPSLRFLGVAALAMLVLAWVGMRAVLLVAFAAAALLILFVANWMHEFRFLMNLSDDAFPGRNDKLIWAMLLIVLAPVGVWLFRSYREVRWAATKPQGAAASSELF